jgi:hypothetical protein
MKRSPHTLALSVFNRYQNYIVPPICLMVMWIVLYPIVTQKHVPGRIITCQSNLKQLGLGLELYAQDWDGYLPSAALWMDAIYPYERGWSVFHCPAVAKSPPTASGYAFNSSLSQQSLSKLKSPGTVPMVYDSDDLSRNAHATGRIGLCAPPRHPEGNHIVFANGHAQAIGPKE